jgi:arsenite methyltransferase
VSRPSSLVAVGPAPRRGRRAGPGRVPRRQDRSIPAGDGSVDCVISNGVVTGQGRSVHRSGPGAATGWRRLAIADIVSQRQLKHSIVCDADLWAACIGGVAQQDAYQELIENAGLAVTTMWRNDYEFISQRARDASARYGVKSISLLAVKSSG